MSICYPSITVVTPCYNEQQTVIRFLIQLQQTLEHMPYMFTVIVVNDGSTDDTLQLLNDFRFTAGNVVLHVISLEKNCGHQAAIYHGLLHARSLTGTHVIVMDADGEDAPSAIAGLLQHTDKDIVNVIRGRRQEPLLFRCCYHIYRMLFRVATGRQMNFGNFCLISRAVMEAAVNNGFAHFAAFLSLQKVSRTYIVADKQARLGSSSRMSFKDHMVHALRSFAEYNVFPAYLFKKPARSNEALYHFSVDDHSEKAI